jgi:hypothetical protein
MAHFQNNFHDYRRLSESQEAIGKHSLKSSNGNDIETKRNYALIIGLFSVSKRNEPTYSRTWKDRSKAKTNINVLCKIEEITNIISLKYAGSKRNEYN